MRIRLPMPYTTLTKGIKEHRLGVGTIDVREVDAEDAPIVAYQTDRYLFSDDGDTTQVTDFRMIDGRFYVPYRTSKDGNRKKIAFSRLEDIPQADNLDAGVFLLDRFIALTKMPFHPQVENFMQIRGDVSWSHQRLIPDTVDDAPKLLKSRSWAGLPERVGDIVLVDGAFYAKSIGPSYLMQRRNDGSRTMVNRNAHGRYLPGSTTRMAWDRDSILEEHAGSVTEEDLAGIWFVDGIDPKSLDTGYDPLALAIEDMAWDLMVEGHSNSVQFASDAFLKAILDLRIALVDRMPEAESMLGERYPENPRRWDTIFTEPDKAYGLMHLIDAYLASHWINGHKTGQIQELRRSLERTLSDEAALSNAFG